MVRKQVAIACLVAYAFLIGNFIAGVLSEPTDAIVLGTKKYYVGRRSMNTSVDITVETDKGNFRSTQKGAEEFIENPNLKLWQTPFYKTTLRYQIQKQDEDIYWNVVNIYIVFSFFPILGMIGGVLALCVKGDWALQYGFQLSLFSAIMFLLTYLMMTII